MTERRGIMCFGAKVRLAAISLTLLLASVFALAAKDLPQPTQWKFCLTSTAFEAATCEPVTVTLPHRFERPSTGPAIGLYRAELPRPPPGSYLLSLQRLSLDGAARVDGRLILDTMDSQRLSRQRYWPQAGRFVVPKDGVEPLLIEIAVRGLSQTKNGLGGVSLQELATGETGYRTALVLDVVLVAALAAAALVAGLVGLSIGGERGRSAKVLAVTSWLAIIAALRCAHNLVTQPPIDMLGWHLLGLWLLALIALQAMHVVLTYLMPEKRWTRVIALGAMAIGILLIATSDPAIHERVVDTLFTMIACVATGLFLLLARQTWRERDSLGFVIFAAFLAVLAMGVHDLLLHFGNASLSARYLQTWSTPGVVIIAIVALTKRAASRRELEHALQQATLRREDLLRELHDRVGSRLVALAFHAKQRYEDSLLLEEIKSLIHEVRMIQHAVGNEATTLEALLADLRHLYSRIGGGQLPLHWNISDLPEPLHLSADQSIAVVRIVEEAIANSLKHAAPSVIRIRLSPATGASRALLEIDDDGSGEFRPSNTGGLHNMKLRAQQTDLRLELRQHQKSIRIIFPAPRKSPPSLLERVRRLAGKHN